MTTEEKNDFEGFKKEFIKYFVFLNGYPEDFNQELNDYYTEFKTMPGFTSIKEWCEFYFVEWDLSTHYMALITQTKKRTVKSIKEVK